MPDFGLIKEERFSVKISSRELDWLLRGILEESARLSKQRRTADGDEKIKLSHRIGTLRDRYKELERLLDDTNALVVSLRTDAAARWPNDAERQNRWIDEKLWLTLNEEAP